MGGFRFQGPNYRIESLPSYPMCRCIGYQGQIDEAVEKLLVEKQNKSLVLSELPQDLQDKMATSHLGNTMAYEVIHKSRYTRNITAEREAMLKDIKYVVRESELLSNNNVSGLDAFFQ